jgi:hypothetical protein
MHFARIVLAVAWTGDSMRLPDRVLEPGERISEILFGYRINFGSLFIIVASIDRLVAATHWRPRPEGRELAAHIFSKGAAMLTDMRGLLDVSAEDHLFIEVLLCVITISDGLAKT